MNPRPKRKKDPRHTQGWQLSLDGPTMRGVCSCGWHAERLVHWWRAPLWAKVELRAHGQSHQSTRRKR